MQHVPADSEEQNELVRLAQPATPGAAARAWAWLSRPAPWLIALLLVLAAAATQLPAAQAALGRSLATTALLRQVMGTSEQTAELPALPEATGAQARALAIMAEDAGQQDAAERFLAAALARDPADELTRFQLCRFYTRQDRWEEAQQTCAGSVASVEYWIQMGVRETDAKRYDEGIHWFQLAAATDPNHSEAWHLLGRAYLNADRFAEAIPAYERVLALDDVQPFDVFNSLGTAYLAVDDLERARQTAERGLLIYPNRRELYLIVGESLHGLGQLDAAEAWYSQWLQQWPHDAFAWSQRGEVAMARQRPADAIGYFQQATVAAPEAAGYWMNLALAAGANGNTTLATAAFDKALLLRPDDATIWLKAGHFLRDTNQTERARVAYEHVLSLQPDNSEAAAELTSLTAAPATP